MIHISPTLSPFTLIKSFFSSSENFIPNIIQFSYARGALIGAINSIAKHFNLNKEISNSNVAATLLKIQEKKTQKGNSYAVVKFSDLGGIFELFIFSDILELNRNILTEGNSILITVLKDRNSGDNRFKRFNVRKIVSLKDFFKQSIKNIVFEISDSKSLKKLSNLIDKKGETNVKIKILDNNEDLTFKLLNKRNIDRDTLKILKKEPYLKRISY